MSCTAHWDKLRKDIPLWPINPMVIKETHIFLIIQKKGCNEDKCIWCIRVCMLRLILSCTLLHEWFSLVLVKVAILCCPGSLFSGNTAFVIEHRFGVIIFTITAAILLNFDGSNRFALFSATKSTESIGQSVYSFTWCVQSLLGCGLKFGGTEKYKFVEFRADIFSKNESNHCDFLILHYILLKKYDCPIRTFFWPNSCS